MKPPYLSPATKQALYKELRRITDKAVGRRPAYRWWYNRHPLLGGLTPRYALVYGDWEAVQWLVHFEFGQGGEK